MPHTTSPIGGQELFSSSSERRHHLGERFTLKDGREVKYVKAGATLVAGNVIQSPAVVANHVTIDVAAAAAIGATQVTVTLGATAATANMYAEGTLAVDTTPGEGYTYRIKSHPAADASASLVLTLYPEDAIRVALTTSSDVTLCKNPCNGVIQAPATTLTGSIQGVAIYPIASGEYGFIGCAGPWATLISNTAIVGATMVSPSGTGGAAVTDPANAAVDIIGRAMSALESGKIQQIDWLPR